MRNWVLEGNRTGLPEPTSQDIPEMHTRRSFYSNLVGILGTVLGFALAVLASTYLLIRPRSAGRRDFVEVVNLGELQIGKPREFTFERTRIDGWRTSHEKVSTWVVRIDEANVAAYSPQCTHLGCAYHWEDQQNKFICPCHASTFSADGMVLAGPAPRPLDRYVIQVRNNRLLVGSRIQRA